MRRQRPDQRRVAAMPPMPGMLMSISTRSGRSSVDLRQRLLAGGGLADELEPGVRRSTRGGRHPERAAGRPRPARARAAARPVMPPSVPPRRRAGVEQVRPCPHRGVASPLRRRGAVLVQVDQHGLDPAVEVALLGQRRAWRRSSWCASRSPARRGRGWPRWPRCSCPAPSRRAPRARAGSGSRAGVCRGPWLAATSCSTTVGSMTEPPSATALHRAGQLADVADPLLEQVRPAAGAALEQLQRVRRLGVLAEQHHADVRALLAQLQRRSGCPRRSWSAASGCR